MAVLDSSDTADILGHPVSRRGLAGDVEEAAGFCRATDRRSRYVACANPHSLVVAKEDTPFRAALRDADLLLPDGAGILLASRVLGADINERVAGTEFFLGLSAHANHAGGFSYFFLGSREEVLEKLTARLARDFPNIRIAGCYSPPYTDVFTDDELAAMIDAVNAAAPTVLWVGMTAPKQEKWIHQNRDRLRVPLIGAIGAVFDFYAGTRARAPKWVCDLGLEWLPRLLREPRRLWRRNFVSTPIFLWDVARQALRGSR
jgi:N-acetylglucosaminyldiphosphoundecaprenol N-acetyl-beta-D-mannosaminyltransferase